MNDSNEISVLVMAIERLSENQSQTNEKVDKLIESMGKQEVILEKLSNIEKNHTESNKRVHKRVDDVEDNIKQIFGKHNTGCNALNNFIIKRELELKHYDEVIDSNIARIKANEDALKELKSIPNKILMRVVLVAAGALTAGWIGMLFLDKG